MALSQTPSSLAMLIPNLTLATIQRHATSKSYDRGCHYWRAGAVAAITQRRQTLQAEVEGNEPNPYRVMVEFDDGGITAATCTCQYSFEGWCKHIVATLLACLQQPEMVEQRPSLPQLLDQLDWVQTQRLIQNLVADNPELIESVDLYVTRLAQPPTTSAPQSAPQRKTNIDPAPFKRRAKEVVRGAVRDWEYGREDDDIAAEIGPLIDNALAFVAQGDVANAMVALQGITEGCAENWDDIDDYIGLTPTDVGLDLDAAWTEVLLSADLTADEISTWQEQLEAWQDQLDSFAMSLEALRQGWDYPPLLQVFAGNLTERGAWAGEAPTWADEFSQIRLKILAQQERYEDYLRLAEAESQTQPYLTMLAQLGRTDEVMAIAPQQITTLTEAKAIAETLRSQNQLPQALQIALQGLRCDGANPYLAHEFATWTSDLATGLDDTATALAASILGFKARPSFKDYQTVQTLAGADWSVVQTDLLAALRTLQNWGTEEAQVVIFLHEELWADAIAIASKLSSYHGQLVLKVMDAVVATHSQWVIDNARPRADSIMDEGKAKYYHHAVDWLKRVKTAHHALGQATDWQQYHRQLKDIHGRKRKLMGLMEQARL